MSMVRFIDKPAPNHCPSSMLPARAQACTLTTGADASSRMISSSPLSSRWTRTPDGIWGKQGISVSCGSECMLGECRRGPPRGKPAGLEKPARPVSADPPIRTQAGGPGSLTEVGAFDSMKRMDQPADSPSFPVRRQVGRPSTPRQVLWQLEEMRRFVQKHTHGKPTIVEGDAFPVRKIVGRPPSGRG